MREPDEPATEPNIRGKTGREKPSILHFGFETAILLKGLHAALEIAGGILLAFLKPETLVSWIRVLTQNELAEDPQDLVANLLVHRGHQYSINSQSFGVIYLVSHVIVNLGIVLLLWRRQLWAYPLGIAILLLSFGKKGAFHTCRLPVFCGMTNVRRRCRPAVTGGRRRLSCA
jgi:uncharacterized membrane protein